VDAGGVTGAPFLGLLTEKQRGEGVRHEREIHCAELKAIGLRQERPQRPLLRPRCPGAGCRRRRIGGQVRHRRRRLRQSTLAVKKDFRDGKFASSLLPAALSSFTLFLSPCSCFSSRLS